MFVTNFNQLDSRFRSLLGTNPFSDDLNNVKGTLNHYQNEHSSMISQIRDYERAIERAKVNRQIYKQQAENANLKMKQIERAFNEASKSVDCEYLDVDSMTKFFQGIGCKFIRLWIESDRARESKILLEYVRPTSFVSYLPTPPLHISIEYRVNNGKVAFYTAHARSPIKTGGDYYHPHISDPGICLGNFTDVIDENEYSILLDGYQDHVLLLNNLLNTYNPDSPYRTPAEILCYAIKKLWINTNAVVCNSSNGYQFSHPKLNTRRETYNIYDVVGIKEIEAYLESLKNVKFFDVADDMVARLMMLEHSGDDNEEHEYMNAMRSTLSNMFPDLSFADVSDYEYDESDDEEEIRYFISEDNFYDLRNSWSNTLRSHMEEMDKEEKITLHQLPDLNAFFVDRETSNDEEREYVFN